MPRLSMDLKVMPRSCTGHRFNLVVINEVKLEPHWEKYQWSM